MVDDKENEGMLSRWSRRKRAIEEEDQQVVSADAKELELSQQDEERELTEEELAHLAQLQENKEAAEAVDLTTLNENSDFSMFMKEGVPALLKKQAMAALWRSSPIFANVDGLVDYGDDFGSPDLIMKTFKSAYQAGRGYLKVIEEQAKTAQALLDKENLKEAEALIEANDDEPVEDISNSDASVENENTEELAASTQEDENLISVEDEDQPTLETATLEEEVVEIPLQVHKVSMRQRLALD